MKLSIASTLALLANISAVSAEVISLTPENYSSATAGKTVFIKFFAPWCGHCKSMASDWEKLAAKYEGSESELIAEVDCTIETNDGICAENGVQGFPTLKYGDASALEDYQGGRDYDSLESFAAQNLKPTCSAFKIELCEGDEKAKLEGYFNLSVDDLKAKVKEVEAIVKASEETFEKGLEELQNTYMDMMEKHEEKMAAEKEKQHYGTIKSVIAYKKSQGEVSSRAVDEEMDDDDAIDDDMDDDAMDDDAMDDDMDDDRMGDEF